MKHFGPALDVVVEVEFEIELEPVELVAVVVTDEAEMCTDTDVLWLSEPLLPVTPSV